MKKRIINILYALASVGFLLFILTPTETIITSTDGDGNVTILNKDSLDAAHKRSFKNYGK